MSPHYERLMSVALIATLAACAGGSKDQSASSSAAPPAAPAAAPAPAPGAAPAAAPGAAPAPAAAPAMGAAGEQQFGTCAVCHQATGLGMPGTFPPLAGSEYVNGVPMKHIAIVLHGLTGPVTVKGQQFNSTMAPLGTMTDDDIAAAINYERSSWGNNGAHVTAADVADVRKKTASRTSPWTVQELNALK